MANLVDELNGKVAIVTGSARNIGARDGRVGACRCGAGNQFGTG